MKLPLISGLFDFFVTSHTISSFAKQKVNTYTIAKHIHHEYIVMNQQVVVVARTYMETLIMSISDDVR
jgi:hypothetical protein